MSEDLKSKRVMVVDNGLFFHTAKTLSESFGEVLYFMRWTSAFPKLNQLMVGDGFDEVKRVRNFWDEAHGVDLFVFPDVYESDLQCELVRQGKRVWGGRKGDELELFRAKTAKMLPSLGLPAPPTTVVIGFDNLRSYLKDHDNVFVKISCMRGMMETWKSENYTLSEPQLDKLEHFFGEVKHVVPFILCDSIDDCVEVGMDAWSIDGQYPSLCGLGYEIKDCGLAMTTKRYEELPEPVLEVNSALSPYLKEHDYRGWLATEIRWKDGNPYLTDPCCRQGTPSSEVLMEMFSNWGEILWNGAEGKVIAPEPVKKFGCEIMLHSKFADTDWQALQFPYEIDRWIKLRNPTKIDGKIYVVPQNVGLPEVGAAVGLGDTLPEAIEQAKERAEQVKGYFLEAKTEAIPKMIAEILEGQKHGIDFGVVESEIPDECLTV